MTRSKENIRSPENISSQLEKIGVVIIKPDALNIYLEEVLIREFEQATGESATLQLRVLLPPLKPFQIKLLYPNVEPSLRQEIEDYFAEGNSLLLLFETQGEVNIDELLLGVRGSLRAGTGIRDKYVLQMPGRPRISEDELEISPDRLSKDKRDALIRNLVHVEDNPEIKEKILGNLIPLSDINRLALHNVELAKFISFLREKWAWMVKAT